MRLILIILTALSFPAAAQVYKWTDENGVTHFGAQPPPGQKEEVRVRNTIAEQHQDAPESDIIRQARELEERKIREAADRAEKELERYRQTVADLQDDSVERPGYVCQGIEDRVQLLYEDMEELKRQGYTISEKTRLERKIKREEMHRDNLCR